MALAKASKGFEAAQEVADILGTTSDILSGINTAVSLGSSALSSAAAEKGVAEAAKVGSQEAAKKVATEGTAQAGTAMAEAAAKGAEQIPGAMPISAIEVAPGLGEAASSAVEAADIAGKAAVPAGAASPLLPAGPTPPSTPAEFVEMFRGGPTETAANFRSQLLGGPIGTAPPHPGMGAALGVQPPPVTGVPSVAPNLVDTVQPLGGQNVGPSFAYHDAGGGSAVLGSPSGFSQTSQLPPTEASTLVGGTNTIIPTGSIPRLPEGGLGSSLAADALLPQAVPSNLPIAGVAGQTPGLLDYASKSIGDVQQAIPGWRHVWRAGQGLTPAAPAFTEFVDDASDFGRQIPLLRRLLSRSGNPARLY